MFDPTPIVLLGPILEALAVPLLGFVVVMFGLQVILDMREEPLPTLFGTRSNVPEVPPVTDTPGECPESEPDILARAA